MTLVATPAIRFAVLAPVGLPGTALCQPRRRFCGKAEVFGVLVATIRGLDRACRRARLAAPAHPAQPKEERPRKPEHHRVNHDVGHRDTLRHDPILKANR